MEKCVSGVFIFVGLMLERLRKRNRWTFMGGFKRRKRKWNKQIKAEACGAREVGVCTLCDGDVLWLLWLELWQRADRMTARLPLKRRFLLACCVTVFYGKFIKPVHVHCA